MKLLSFISIIILLATEISCTNNFNNNKKDVSEDSMTIQKDKLKADSITTVDICFYPSFTNSSILSLNRLKGEGVFIVDKRMTFNYGIPDTLKFQVNDIETKTDIKSFWRSSFLHSLQPDTSMLGATDGMAVWVFYINNQIKDSVYLGNVHSKSVDSLLSRQLDYLSGQAKSEAMKKYLKQVKEYL